MRERRVLVVEADPVTRRHLSHCLVTWGYEPVVVTSVDEAIGALAHMAFLFTLLGLRLDDAPGLEFLRRLDVQGGEPGPVIVLTDGEDVGMLGDGAAFRADGFVQRSFLPGDLENAIRDALARPRRRWGRMAEDAADRLQEEIALWRSAPMREVRHVLEQAARVDVTVLLCGETGTGKEVAARAIHALSSRRSQPFVKVNCAAVPRELLESELFGHERGAFTGAHQLKIGKFESANHGTVFLDEIGDLHSGLQAKLLHVLQDGTFSRVGAKSTIKMDVRVIAATNQDLERAVAQGRFREDLYYRLNVIQVVLPPLRDRPEEIPVLVDYFARRYARLFDREGFSVPAHVLERLAGHRYPGNVRELENLIKRMIVLNDPLLVRIPFPPERADDASNGEHAPEGNGSRPGASLVGPEVLTSSGLKAIARQAARAAEREAITRVLAETGWNRTRAAKRLKISYRALLYKIKEIGLHRDLSAS